METRILTVSHLDPDPDAIGEAANLLRTGRLVAFPTETVYGLGANALDAGAVAAIYEAKGRPARNPLIVHIHGAEQARGLSADWPARADLLARAFWPGPLTLVVARAPFIPDIVTAGGATVALRVPAAPVALALLRAADVPVAAPSANRSNRVSPTRAAHVLRHLGGRIPLILDGGPTPGGIESTVLDVTGPAPRLLRPGLVTRAQLEEVVGPIDGPAAPAPTDPERTDAPLASPGMMRKHYAPNAPLELAEPARAAARVAAILADDATARVGWLHIGCDAPGGGDPRLTLHPMPDTPRAYAARLYDALHAMDDAGVTRIVADAPPRTPDWHAVNDRLGRAASSQNHPG